MKIRKIRIFAPQRPCQVLRGGAAGKITHPSLLIIHCLRNHVALYRRGRSQTPLLVLPVERDVERLPQSLVIEGDDFVVAGEELALRQLLVVCRRRYELI
jgi:hypothetical protein